MHNLVLNFPKSHMKKVLTSDPVCGIIIMSGGDADPSPSEGRPLRAEQGDAKWQSTSLPTSNTPEYEVRGSAKKILKNP